MQRLTVSLLLALSGIAAASGCAAVGEQCSLWNTCCGSAHCRRKGFLNWRCVEQCAPEGETCGGPGLPNTECCDGMECKQHLLGTDNKQCVKREPQCAQDGQTCGGPGLPNTECCDGMECKQHLLGTDNKQCVKREPQCAQDGQTCAGPGLPNTECCDGMECKQHFVGTDNKQCVKKERQCIQAGEICGCTGCRPQACCGGGQCLDVSGQGGKMFCVEVPGRSFAVENITALPAAANSTEGLGQGLESMIFP